MDSILPDPIVTADGRTEGRGRTVCRACGHAGLLPFVDLGLSPLCESFVPAQALGHGEQFHPLDVKVCPACWLAQLGEYVAVEEIFSEYAYFSSYSQAWLEHARHYTEIMVGRLGLDAGSFVVEVASNDGYLLRSFVERGIPCLGIEPAANVARAAADVGVDTLVRFFGRDLATELAAMGRQADLITGNNVLAQVPDLNDFVAGLARLLKPDGVLTLEFPHLARLLAENQFDTIYHEHFSYFSLGTVRRLLAAHGLRVFDVDELWSHGGSLRVFACREQGRWATMPAVAALLAREEGAGLFQAETYAAFGRAVAETKFRLLDLLIDLKRRGKRVVGYGAPGKGNTLLNYCGIRTDLLDFTVDRNPYKHGRYLPGTRIPIHAPERLLEAKPDAILILPWNLKDEIMAQLAEVRSWGCRFIVPVPVPTVLD
ncbi:class I SAM-dependent methyltransferase [Oleisolibacter albus]|uniref:class I SAM-dependent methyltransferase n=1 Tax=Oleisolibacter albus TaxID=2171757 RepID=UPI001EFDCB3C|nr:class I SAM-dependent methyltransferase [Oleisolibacter albus]